MKETTTDVSIAIREETWKDNSSNSNMEGHQCLTSHRLTVAASIINQHIKEQLTHPGFKANSQLLAEQLIKGLVQVKIINVVNMQLNSKSNNKDNSNNSQ